MELQVSSPALVVRRKSIEARLLAKMENFEEATRLFAEALPSAKQHLDNDDLLGFQGSFLEVLGVQGSRNTHQIYQLADDVIHGISRAYLLQRSAHQRRRLIEKQQRVVESTVLALLGIAENHSNSANIEQAAERQVALLMVWKVISCRRNLELHQIEVAPHPATKRGKIEELENDFHLELRDYLLIKQRPSRHWENALAALEELEISTSADPTRLRSQEKMDHNIASLTLFEIRDLGREMPIVVLSYIHNRFTFRFLPRESETYQRLMDWAEAFSSASQRAHRGVRRHRVTMTSSKHEGPGFEHFLSESHHTDNVYRISGSLQRLSDSLAVEYFPTESREPDPDIPWLILTEGELSVVPMEMLPDAEGADLRFGEDRAVIFGLRNELPARAFQAIDFGKGWLGLGGVPGSPAFRELPGSVQEVGWIQELLQEAKMPTATLLGQEARADLLRKELSRHCPAVLHLAVHGIADSEYPEACALILADRPNTSERELLPFRHISNLPLDGVDLVVLSACSSLIGRSGRADTMRGLAWAFLRAGVPQVIASRYPVDDRATARLMLILYEQLLSGLPVGMALGKTRRICLRQEGMDEKEVAAWSCWC